MLPIRHHAAPPSLGPTPAKAYLLSLLSSIPGVSPSLGNPPALRPEAPIGRSPHVEFGANISWYWSSLLGASGHTLGPDAKAGS